MVLSTKEIFDASAGTFFTETYEVEDTLVSEEKGIDEDYVKSQLKPFVQEYLDTKIKERDYDNIVSLCSYILSTNPKSYLEAQAGIKFRDACWDKYYEVVNSIVSGSRNIPTQEELTNELPNIEWPI